MGDFRKYACELSGHLFKSINKKGIRREKLAVELGVSVNQIKNYAYDSTKSATLENFLHALIKYNNTDVLNVLAKEMGCCVCVIPETGYASHNDNAAAEALAEAAMAVSSYISKDRDSSEISENIHEAVRKLLTLEKTL